MDSYQRKSQKPLELRPSWIERLLHWSGWEHMMEYRLQLMLTSLLVVALILLLCFWYSRSETSTVATNIRAEAIVQRLRHPGSVLEGQEISEERDLQYLKRAAPVGSFLGQRLSGIIAEEEMLQHVSPISIDRFDTAANTLKATQLPLASSVTMATCLTCEHKIAEALEILDTTIVASNDDWPHLHAYVLLQKATLLRQQQKSNSFVLDELMTFLSSNHDVEASFDHIFSGKTRDVFGYLRTESTS